MAYSTGSAPLSANRQDMLRRLGDSLGQGLDRLNVLDLQPARDHFAGDWPRLSAKVHSIVEGTLRKCLPENDSFAALDDMCYAVISSAAGAADIRDTLERISEEVTRRIMGEGSRKVFVSITSAAPDTKAAAEAAKAVAAPVSNIDRIIGDMASAEDAFSFAAIRFVVRPMLAHDNRVTGILVPAAVCPTGCGRARGGYDCLPPEPDAALVAELDALTAETAAKHLNDMERQGRPGLMQVPVHRATLSSRKWRELYLKICRGLFARHKNRLIFDIFGIEDGTPGNRVTEHMQWLRPYGRAISATVDVDFSTMASFGGTQVLSLGVTLDGVEDEVADSKLARAVPRLKAAEPRCHVHGLRTQSQVGLCRSLAVAAMNGVVVEEGGQARLELVRDGS